MCLKNRRFAWRRLQRALSFVALSLLSMFGRVSDSALAQDSSEPPTLVIVGGHRFETESGRFLPNSIMTIRDGRFEQFGNPEREQGAAELEQVQLLRLSDQDYILPGLIDLHAHYNVRLNRIRREEFEVNPILYLANGVTVTFTAGEYDPEGMLELKKDIEAGEKIGPRILNAGPYFGTARPGWRRNPPSREQIFAEVDHWARMGVGGFKAKLIDPESLQALIDRAHLHGLTVTGHLESGYRNSVNPKDAVEMGIDRVEHFLGGDALVPTRSAYQSLAELTPDREEFKEIVQIFVESGTWYDATITAFGYFGERGEEYDPWIDERQFLTPWLQERIANRAHQPTELYERVYQAKQDLILPYFTAGGKITLGTDHFSNGDYLSGFCAHRELDAFVRAGIPAADAIRIGSLNGALAMGIEADHGSIEPGKVADLFVVSGDPLQNIRNTRNVRYVVRAGQVYNSATLLDSVKGQMGPNNEAELPDW